MNYEIDATNKKIGRLASEIALILQGKKNPKYEPRIQGEDKVVVKNIDKLEISPKKLKQKVYYRHSGPLGHLKEQTLGQLIEKRGPAEALKKAIKGMLPKNRLLIKRMKRLAIE